MCLAVPGKVLEIHREETPLMGNVDFAGVQKQICLEWTPEVRVGDYVIVHVGFALNTIDEQEAEETLLMLKQMGAFDDEVH